MSRISPLTAQHKAYAQNLAGVSDTAVTASRHRPGAAVGQRTAIDVQTIPWGVRTEAGDLGRNAALSAPACEIIATFGEVEPEYATIRRGAGLFDSPHRGTLVVKGAERRDFLNRLLTQELKDLAAGHTRETLWLNRKGRIDADLFLIELGEHMLVDLDVADVSAAAKSLNEFIFAEDVEIRDASEELHHIAVHGRLARETIVAASSDEGFDLASGAARSITIDGIPVTIARHDLTGEVGYELIMPRDTAAGVWEFLLAADHIVSDDKHRVRPIGWHAFNIARIEAGTPLFNIDFGPTNLPHQLGARLPTRVSFTKGCYLGQEVVARMHSRGHSKPVIVGLRMLHDRLPVAGAQVHARAEGEAPGEPIGVVTSSTLSPMLGAVPVALALVRASDASDGAKVLVDAEGEQTEAVVGPSKFWPPAGAAA